MRLRVLIFLCCGLVSRSAIATPIPESEMYEINPATSSMPKANPTTMPWCTGKFTGESWNGKVDKFIAPIKEHDDYVGLADAAEHLCEHKEDKSWVKVATYLVQRWMNSTETTQAEAEKAIADKIASLKAERTPEGQDKLEQAKFEFGENDLDVIKPDPGIDVAKITDKPSWCDVVAKFAVADRWKASQIHRTIDSTNGIQGTIEGASHLCQRPTDTTWKAEAGYVVQKWMNWTHLSQADAEKAIRARVQTGKFAAGRDELCKALQVSPELGGAEKTYAEARLEFFGCTNDNQTIWQDGSQVNPTGVGFFLDGDSHADELMRAYWLFAFVRPPSDALPSKNASENLPLLYYAIAQTDFARLDYAAIDKMLSAAPYNDYARIVAMETLGVLKARHKVYEQAVDKMTKGDEDYTTILRTAPKKAFADWDKMAAQWKPEIERSNAFEKLLSQPSRKAIKGCSTEMFKDGEKLIKSLKTNNYKALVDKISGDPIANLLLSRIAICFAADKVWGASGALKDLVAKGRNLRGPRSLAYYAVVDAIADAKKDRPRLLLDLSNFFQNGSVLSGHWEEPGAGLDFSGGAPREWEKSDNKGIVGSTKKVEDGVQVVFKTVKLKYADQNCVDDVRHPLRINLNGEIVYYQNCKPTGTFTYVDVTPASFVTSPLLTANIKPGVFLQYVDVSEHAKNGNPFGIAVYTSKSSEDKKINTFFGFAL